MAQLVRLTFLITIAASIVSAEMVYEFTGTGDYKGVNYTHKSSNAITEATELEITDLLLASGFSGSRRGPDLVAAPTSLLDELPDTIAINGIQGQTKVFSFPDGAFSKLGSHVTLPGVVTARLTVTQTPATVPEPSSLALLAATAAGVAFTLRRQLKRRA